MTWALGQHNSGQSNTSSTSVPSGVFGTGATSTTLVVGFVAFDDAAVGVDNLTSVTDNASGNTYNLGHSGISVATGTWIKGFWLYGPSGNPTQFTANFSAAHTNKTIYTAFFTSSISGTITLDANPIVNSGNSATPTSSSVTPAVTGELAVAGVGDDGGGVFSAGGSATFLDQDTVFGSSTPLGGDEYLVLGTGAQTLTFGNTISSTWAVAILTFKEPSAAAPSFVSFRRKRKSPGVHRIVKRRKFVTATLPVTIPRRPRKKPVQVLHKRPIHRTRSAPFIGAATFLNPPSKAWVWNHQAALLNLTLGTVSKAWNWNGQAALLNLTLGTVSKAWVWTKNAISGLPFSLGVVSKAWNWVPHSATLVSTSIKVTKWNIMRPLLWGVLRGEEERPKRGP